MLLWTWAIISSFIIRYSTITAKAWTPHWCDVQAFIGISLFCRPGIDGDDENRWEYLQTHKPCLQEITKPLGFRFNWNPKGFNGFGKDRLSIWCARWDSKPSYINRFGNYIVARKGYSTPSPPTFGIVRCNPPCNIGQGNSIRNTEKRGFVCSSVKENKKWKSHFMKLPKVCDIEIS